MKPASLDPRAVYLTPTGRRCKWVPLIADERRQAVIAHFEYLNDLGAFIDGFNQTPANYRILRKEGEHAARR